MDSYDLLWTTRFLAEASYCYTDVPGISAKIDAITGAYIEALDEAKAAPTGHGDNPVRQAVLATKVPLNGSFPVNDVSFFRVTVARAAAMAQYLLSDGKDVTLGVPAPGELRAVQGLLEKIRGSYTFKRGPEGTLSRRYLDEAIAAAGRLAVRSFGVTTANGRDRPETFDFRYVFNTKGLASGRGAAFAIGTGSVPVEHLESEHAPIRWTLLDEKGRLDVREYDGMILRPILAPGTFRGADLNEAAQAAMSGQHWVDDPFQDFRCERQIIDSPFKDFRGEQPFLPMRAYAVDGVALTDVGEKDAEDALSRCRKRCGIIYVVDGVAYRATPSPKLDIEAHDEMDREGKRFVCFRIRWRFDDGLARNIPCGSWGGPASPDLKERGLRDKPTVVRLMTLDMDMGAFAREITTAMKEACLVLAESDVEAFEEGPVRGLPAASMVGEALTQGQTELDMIVAEKRRMMPGIREVESKGLLQWLRRNHEFPLGHGMDMARQAFVDVVQGVLERMDAETHDEALASITL